MRTRAVTSSYCAGFITRTTVIIPIIEPVQPGAIRDYLGWLLDVDALRMVGKRYFYVDGLVRWWVRLYTAGTPPGPQELERAAREVVEEGRGILAPAPPLTTQPVRTDSLMEID